MHPEVKDEADIREMEGRIDPQIKQRGPRLDIPRSEGVQFETSFPESMISKSTYTLGPYSHPSFLGPPRTKIPSQAPHAPDHVPWMDLFA